MLTPEQTTHLRHLQAKVVKLESLMDNAHRRIRGPVDHNALVSLRLAARKLEEDVNKARLDLYRLETLRVL